jgi:3-deoxy-D-manno-octulosonate 8-phosphate phosphatase (KDO 8-P phosphatase)
MKKSLISKLKNVTHVISDVDGTLTSGSLLFDEKGRVSKSFHIRDGLRIKLALESGLRVVLVSGRRDGGAAARARELGVPAFLGVGEKHVWYQKFAREKNLKKEEVLFIGDDVNDLEMMALVGVAAAPLDAAVEVKAQADLISNFDGGEGVVAEIIELVLKAQDKWPTNK